MHLHALISDFCLLFARFAPSWPQLAAILAPTSPSRPLLGANLGPTWRHFSAILADFSSSWRLKRDKTPSIAISRSVFEALRS